MPKRARATHDNPPVKSKLPSNEVLLELLKTKTYAEIAAMYGVNPTSVGVRLTRYRVKNGIAQKATRSTLSVMPPKYLLEQWLESGLAPEEIRQRSEEFAKGQKKAQ